VASRRPPDAASLARLNRYVTEMLSAAQLSVSDDRVVLASSDPDSLDAVVAGVVGAAIDLLTSDVVQRIGRCADEPAAGSSSIRRAAARGGGAR